MNPSQSKTHPLSRGYLRPVKGFCAECKETFEEVAFIQRGVQEEWSEEKIIEFCGFPCLNAYKKRRGDSLRMVRGLR